MSLFGAPAEIVSDNGPQYSSQPFKEMCRNWGVKHTTSSPRYPRSNGLAERTVRTLKSLIKKCTQTRQSIQVALLHLRATPIGPDLPSPAEMMFGRLVRTTLPSHHFARIHQRTEVHDKLISRQQEMKQYHDKHAGAELKPLHTGQKVRVRCPDDNMWVPAEITNVCKEPRSYVVTTHNGSSWRRNRSEIRDVPESDITTNTRNTPPVTDNLTDTRDIPPEPNNTTSQYEDDDTTPVRRHVHFAENPTQLQPPKPKNNNQNNPAYPNTRSTRSTYNTITRSGRISRRPTRFGDK
ncbi:uncharacterized protein K02A2.6-like [Anneissia japonica]|uniref:uncharacterized protein K02A2.6-like n=1 Tax=Anneissia japonica TaxID=1529436 RepID=UPI0014255BB7|nr:uncharacterized protein K02A2.6-like [Anneissia japonica]